MTTTLILLRWFYPKRRWGGMIPSNDQRPLLLQDRTRAASLTWLC
jgi:hypothetical protein